MTNSFGVAVLLVISSITLVQSTDEYHLRFLSVVFRHGDRAPDDNRLEMYPNDPYRKEDFWPMGPGGLTNQGKRREYQLGQVLRSEYQNFLGSVYHPEDIMGRSTDYTRTKMSLLLVLAALYPPAPVQEWLPELAWQPIPIEYVPSSLDDLLFPDDCKRYTEELERVKSSPEVREMVEKFQPLMHNLTIFTGKPIREIMDAHYLYHSLVAESSLGLELPEWTRDYFPDGPLVNASILEYQIQSYNKKLRRLNGGILLQRIIDDMKASINPSGRTDGKKIHLFSGHETNIAALLMTMGCFEPHVPEYGSAIIVELLSRADGHFVRVRHYLGIPAVIEDLRIPGCDVFCPLADFIGLLQDAVPTDDDIECVKDPQMLQFLTATPESNNGED